MQQVIDAISDLHGQLADALEAGDVELIRDIVLQRQTLLSALANAWQEADDNERFAQQARLHSLRHEEQNLLLRCEAMRDDLYARLKNCHRPAKHVQIRDVVSNLDYQA